MFFRFHKGLRNCKRDPDTGNTARCLRDLISGRQIETTPIFILKIEISVKEDHKRELEKWFVGHSAGRRFAS